MTNFKVLIGLSSGKEIKCNINECYLEKLLDHSSYYEKIYIDDNAVIPTKSIEYIIKLDEGNLPSGIGINLNTVNTITNVRQSLLK